MSEAEVTDRELTEYARSLWATDEYKAWSEQISRAIADGLIRREPPLNGAASAS